LGSKERAPRNELRNFRSLAWLRASSSSLLLRVSMVSMSLRMCTSWVLKTSSHCSRSSSWPHTASKGTSTFETPCCPSRMSCTLAPSSAASSVRSFASNASASPISILYD